MRKIAVFFAVLLLAAGVCAGSVIARMSAAQTDVALTRTVSWGDEAAAAGLQVTANVKLNSRLFWRTCFAADGSSGPETVFDYFNSRQEDLFANTDKGYFYLFDYARMGMSSNQAIDLDNPYDNPDRIDAVDATLDGLAPLIRAVAANTPAGQTHKETLRLADHMEYYPLAVDINLREHSELTVAGGISGLMQALRKAFPIPVSPNDCPEIEVTKNAAGEIVGVNVNNSLNGKGDSFYCTSLIVEDAAPAATAEGVERTGSILFAVYGDALEQAAIPGGCSIYRLPWQVVSRKGGQDNRSTYHSTQLLPGDLEPAYPLEPGDWLLHLSEANGALLLLTRRADACLLTVLDMASGKELQCIPLPQSLQGIDPGAELNYVLLQGDLLLVLLSDGQFTLLQHTGSWQPVLTGNHKDTQPHGVHLFQYPNNTSLAWDGSRLAVAGYAAQWYDPDGTTVHLGIFDETGLLHAACWASSLGRNEGYSSSDKATMPTNAAPVTLNWDGA